MVVRLGDEVCAPFFRYPERRRWCSAGWQVAECVLASAVAMSDLLRSPSDARPVGVSSAMASLSAASDLSVEAVDVTEFAESAASLAVGDVVAGKYRIERLLGAGGMGVVFAARHLVLDHKVALKFIHPRALLGKGNIERFMREARAVVGLKSEHVARVYDVGNDSLTRPFIVLELLEGMDLAKLNQQSGPLPVADVVEYMLQTCEALVEAHACGLVHRDLKPQNLFVTRRLNGTPLVKVLDFGIAKSIGPGAVGQLALTDSASMVGSPLFMAPEQMRSSRTAEFASDQWAVGVILYVMLGGALPFNGETLTEVCVAVVNEIPAPLLDLRPTLNAELAAVVMRCLEKSPAARFANVASLAAALEPFSRSATQHGPVRPWRSLESTQDPQDRALILSLVELAFLPSCETDDAATVERMVNPMIMKAAVIDYGEPSALGTVALASTGGTWGHSGPAACEPVRRPRPVPFRLASGLLAALVATGFVMASVFGASAPKSALVVAASTNVGAEAASDTPWREASTGSGPRTPHAEPPAPTAEERTAAVGAALSTVIALSTAATSPTGSERASRPRMTPRAAMPDAGEPQTNAHAVSALPVGIHSNGAPILR